MGSTLLIGGALAGFLSVVLMLRIQREDEDVARGIRKRLSTGGLTRAFCLVVGLIGITLTALVVVLHGGGPPLTSIFFVVILCAGLANRPSKNDDQIHG